MFLPQISSNKIVEQNQTTKTKEQKAKTGRKNKSMIVIVPKILSFEMASRKKQNLTSVKDNRESGSSFSVAKTSEQSKEECSLRTLALRNQNTAQVYN